MSGDGITWTDFGWHGIRLRVPDDWNLGKVEGDFKSGYARLEYKSGLGNMAKYFNGNQPFVDDLEVP